MKRRRDGDGPLEIAQMRLIAWTSWHHEQHFALTPSGATVEARLIESNFSKFYTLNKARFRWLWRKTDNPMPCKETRSSSGDGGMGAFVDRAHASLQWDKRCREVQDAYETMPNELRAIVQARYIGFFRDLPRSFDAAGEILGLPKVTYWEQHKKMLEWLAARIGLVDAKAA